MMNQIKIIILVLLAMLVGCDWFDDTLDANLPPDTELLACGADQGVVEGDDVRFAWQGSDVDGDVAGWEWSYDGGPWEPTPKNTIDIFDVAGGEHLFRVRAIDDDGDVDPTPAECLFTASVAGQLVDRVVLIELFTTNTCPNCPKSEIALNSILDDLGAAAISVIAYHDRPDKDGLATVQTDERIAWYTDEPAFPGRENLWPTAVFDGLRIVEGAYTADEAETNYRLEVATRAETGSPMSLRIWGDIASDRGDVTVVVKAEDEPPPGSLVLKSVVVEDDVQYRGYFASEFDFVARILLGDEALSLTTVADSATVERQFAVDSSWVVEKLDVIVFVQDTQTMEVIQSGGLKLD